MMVVEPVYIVSHASGGGDLGMVGAGRCEAFGPRTDIEKMSLIGQPAGKRPRENLNALIRALGL